MSINTPTPPRPAAPGPQSAAGPGPQPAAVSRGTARTHVRRLRQDGATYRGIAAAAGLGATTVHDLISGHHRTSPRTAAAILSVTPQSVPRARVDAGGTRLRLRALHVMGHGSARLARAAGVREITIRKLVSGDARTLTPHLRDEITGVYDTWWDKRAPEQTPSQRSAAAAARKRAIAGNWCAPAALDDDQLDTPGYRPRYGWKPATGTGTAPDIRPPVRHNAKGGA